MYVQGAHSNTIWRLKQLKLTIVETNSSRVVVKDAESDSVFTQQFV